MNLREDILVLSEAKENTNYFRGGLTIPQLISQLQKAYNKYGNLSIRFSDTGDWNEWSLVNGFKFNPETHTLDLEAKEDWMAQYDEPAKNPDEVPPERIESRFRKR